jgi:hypothetical protein
MLLILIYKLRKNNKKLDKPQFFGGKFWGIGELGKTINEIMSETH